MTEGVRAVMENPKYSVTEVTNDLHRPGAGTEVHPLKKITSRGYKIQQESKSHNTFENKVLWSEIKMNLFQSDGKAKVWQNERMCS